MRIFERGIPSCRGRKSRGLRNRIVHDYFGLDLEIIWQVISQDIPTVKREVENCDEKITAPFCHI